MIAIPNRIGRNRKLHGWTGINNRLSGRN